MSPRRFGRFGPAVAAVVFALAFCSSASAAEPLPYSSLTPNDGLSFTAGQAEPFGIGLQSSAGLWFVKAEVSTSNLPGQDGTLADDFRVWTYTLLESDAFPGTYRTSTYSSRAPWEDKPGTYYWQLSAFCPYSSPCAGGGGANHEYVGPVRQVVVATPPAPPPSGGGDTGGDGTTVTGVRGITSSEARSYIRTMLRQKTNGTVRRLTRQCSGTGSRTVACYLSWRIGRYRFQGTARLRHYVENQTLYWYYTFKGSKKKIGCSRCRAKVLRWR